MEIVLSTAHWIYLAIIVFIIFLMVIKKDIVFPSILGVLVVGLIYSGGNIVFSLQSIFRSMVVAGQNLFDILLVISLMVGLTTSLGKIGADTMMISPAAKLIKSPNMAFWVIAGVMYIAALFFWPSPAMALVAIVLIPVALKVGIRPVMAASAASIAGYGMALSQDIVIQGAPSISAAASGVPISSIIFYSTIFSFATGITALIITFIINRKKMGIEKSDIAAMEKSEGAAIEKVEKAAPNKYAKFFAIGVPIVLLVIVVNIIAGGIIGREATALLGGTAALIIFAASLAEGRDNFLRSSVESLREGFMFSLRVFGPVIPIAGFFMMGAPAHSVSILGEGAPGFLFDLSTALAYSLPLSPAPIAIGTLFIGVLTGLDGSGFSGLPLVGALAANLAMVSNLSPAILVALGQVGAVFSGGGALVAWAIAHVAGFCGVSANDIVRKNFGPVLVGFGVALAIAIVLL